MAKAVRIGNRDSVIHKIKLMLELIKSCSRDATFMFTYEIVQIDKDFMKKSEKMNQKLRKYEQEQANKELQQAIKERKQQDNM